MCFFCQSGASCCYMEKAGQVCSLHGCFPPPWWRDASPAPGDTAGDISPAGSSVGPFGVGHQAPTQNLGRWQVLLFCTTTLGTTSWFSMQPSPNPEREFRSFSTPVFVSLVRNIRVFVRRSGFPSCSQLPDHLCPGQRAEPQTHSW